MSRAPVTRCTLKTSSSAARSIPDVLGRASLDFDAKHEQRLVAQGREVGDGDHAHCARLLEPADARAHRGRRDLQVLRDLLVGGPPILLQEFDDALVDLVELGRVREMDAPHLPA